jgi:PAS domain S-box-containing protein
MRRPDRIHYAIVALLCGLVGASAIGVRSVQSLHDAGTAVRDAHELVAAAATLLGEMKDVETGGRGFLITGRESFLEPYHAALPRVASALAEVERLSDGDAELQGHTRAVRELVAGKLAFVERSIEARRGAAAGSPDSFDIAEGKRLMDGIRRELAELAAIQGTRVSIAERLDRQATRWAHTATWTAAAAGVVLAAMLLASIRRLVKSVESATRAAEETRTAERREEWFRSLAECVNVGIFVMDDRRRTVYRNSTMQSLTGVTLQEMPSPLSNAIFPDEVRRERDALLWRLDRGEHSGTGEMTIERPDGERRRILARWAPLAASENGTSTIVSLTDVTEVDAARSRIRELARRIDHVRDEEAARLADRLHEGVAQDLYAAKLQLAKCRDSERAAESLDAVDALIARVLTGLRSVSHELRPTGLAHLSLARLVENYADSYADLTGLVIDVQFDEEPDSMDVQAKWMLLRAVREALTNVSKHAQASCVDVLGLHSAEGFLLAVTDDGRGIEPADLEAPTALGLLGLRERASELGGTVKIERVKPGGTRLSVWIPHAPTDADA